MSFETRIDRHKTLTSTTKNKPQHGETRSRALLADPTAGMDSLQPAKPNNNDKPSRGSPQGYFHRLSLHTKFTMKIIAVLAATAASASAFAPATSGVRCTFLIDTILSYCRRMKKNPLRKGREGYHSAHGGATTMAILL